jgi:hypothetical protein
MRSELKMFGLWAVFALLIGGTVGAATLLTGSAGAGVVIGGVAFLLIGGTAYDGIKQWAER